MKINNNENMTVMAKERKIQVDRYLTRMFNGVLQGQSVD